MRIVHIAPNAPYNENWGYQENILPKYHRKMGHDVTLITSCFKHENGKIVDTAEEDRVQEDGVRLIRRKQRRLISRTISNCVAYIPVYGLLKEINPDFIFFHGLISWSVMDAVRFKKSKPSCIIVQDNHMDYNIGYSSDTLRKKLLRSWYRYLNHRSIGFVARVYGVTPWRKTYAADYFHIPEDKLDVLIMGADDVKIDFSRKQEIRQEIRNRYGINDETFLIVTGGKIDKNKKTDVLVKACADIQGIKLLVFGQIADDCEDYFRGLFHRKDNIIYAGWIDANKVYDYYLAADLVVFPGQHSVLWEQACACKVPCLFARWDGMEHVNNGGNSAFIDDVSVVGIQSKIQELLFTNTYYKMKTVAESEKTDVFLYSNIAKKSLETVEKMHVFKERIQST